MQAPENFETPFKQIRQSLGSQNFSRAPMRKSLLLRRKRSDDKENLYLVNTKKSSKKTTSQAKKLKKLSSENSPQSSSSSENIFAIARSENSPNEANEVVSPELRITLEENKENAEPQPIELTLDEFFGKICLEISDQNYELLNKEKTTIGKN